jgi:hypothetical protein
MTTDGANQSNNPGVPRSNTAIDQSGPQSAV